MELKSLWSLQQTWARNRTGSAEFFERKTSGWKSQIDLQLIGSVIEKQAAFSALFPCTFLSWQSPSLKLRRPTGAVTGCKGLQCLRQASQGHQSKAWRKYSTHRNPYRCPWFEFQSIFSSHFWRYAKSCLFKLTYWVLCCLGLYSQIK